jgi:predicted nuclease of predicted toxin-antitoxin system
MPRFLVDANLPGSAARVFQDHGYEAVHVRDFGLGDAPDSQIAALAQIDGFTLVTRDMDFADIRRYPPEKYAGLMVLRLPDDANAHEINDVLAKFCRNPSWVVGLPGRLAILEPDRLRFRPFLAE